MKVRRGASEVGGRLGRLTRQLFFSFVFFSLLHLRDVASPSAHLAAPSSGALRSRRRRSSPSVAVQPGPHARRPLPSVRPSLPPSVRLSVRPSSLRLSANCLFQPYIGAATRRLARSASLSDIVTGRGHTPVCPDSQ